MHILTWGFPLITTRDDEFHSFLYQVRCDCGKVHSLITQRDHDPEYHTKIFVVCDCSQELLFKLPVN